MSTEGNIFTENKSNPYPFQHKDWNSFMMDLNVLRTNIKTNITEEELSDIKHINLIRTISSLQRAILSVDLPKASNLLAECQQEFQKTQTDKTVQSIVDKF